MRRCCAWYLSARRCSGGCAEGAWMAFRWFTERTIDRRSITRAWRGKRSVMRSFALRCRSEVARKV